MCEICSQLTIKTPDRRRRLSGVFFVNFKHIPHCFVVFLVTLLRLGNIVMAFGSLAIHSRSDLTLIYVSLTNCYLLRHGLTLAFLHLDKVKEKRYSHIKVKMWVHKQFQLPCSLVCFHFDVRQGGMGSSMTWFS